jgi:hypothetical protein
MGAGHRQPGGSLISYLLATTLFVACGSLAQWPTQEELSAEPGAPSARHWAWMRSHNGGQRRLAAPSPRTYSGELQVLALEGEELIYVLVVGVNVQFPLDVSKVRDELPELTSGERACMARMPACSLSTCVPPSPPSPLNPPHPLLCIGNQACQWR